MSSNAAPLLLIASLFGSYVNIPVAQFPEENIAFGRKVSYFGMHYVVPVVADWPGTVIAVNVGGAVIPTLLSIYLMARNALWGAGLLRPAS